MTSVPLRPRLSGIVTTSATFQYANVLRNTEYTVALLYSISASFLNAPCEHISVMLCLRIPSIPVFVLRVLWVFNHLSVSASLFCCCFLLKKCYCCNLMLSVIGKMNLPIHSVCCDDTDLEISLNLFKDLLLTFQKRLLKDTISGLILQQCNPLSMPYVTFLI